ncbi:stage II sporulation protein R [Alkalibacillus almallahensis]|uniref:stage II sporulation protein R n=1 Tax=Alkalibacillus almallahensis TaxID=1379154 RepID=UPI00141DA4EF|nr:stage II sporulation protein R [Alkalibacillus almallahensis]
MRVVILVLIGLILMPVFLVDTVADEEEESDFVVIPDEAIRLRILADSNSEKDQAEKRQIRDEVSEQITEWVETLTSIDKARATIKQNLPEIEAIVDQNTEDSVSVEFGEVMFPDKVYDRFVYPAGEYEAILITLGEGEGDNWWCVLFPPLCFVEFSDGGAVLEHDEDTGSKQKEAESEKEEERETTFFIWEWLKNLFN